MTQHTSRTLLCIDAGNTLVKWCVHSDSRQPVSAPQEIFSQPTAQFKPFGGSGESAELLHQHLSTLLNNTHSPVEAVLLSNVLGPDFEDMVRALCGRFKVPLHVLAVNANQYMQSAYDNPQSLGKDRWAACLAVSTLSNMPVNLLVGFGTATTLDALLQADSWQHLGGFIVPGVGTMFDSLHRNTAELPCVQLSQPNAARFWPSSTQQAIGEGVGRMQAAMIDSLVNQLDREHGQVPAVWFSGGFAPQMHAFFPQAHLLEHAVFKGLVLDYQLTQQGSA